MADAGIGVAGEDPWYWEYDGEPTLLVGGSNTDNPFQWTGDQLRDHLDELVAVGGNYIRNTMSDRGGNDVHAFDEVYDGAYDLTSFNETYFERLEDFLDETAARDIVVHLTLWDQHDLSESHPFAHQNNVNYGRYDSGIASAADIHQAVDRNEVVYPHLERFVDRVLDVAFEYEHVIYNVNNESTTGEEWERHWAEYVHERADSVGRDVDVTSMNMWPGRSVAVARRYPETITFVEVSQANQDSKGYTGQAHWDALRDWRQEIEEHVGPRPFNNVKIYGTDAENASAGSAAEAVERFWRNLLGGAASARFHRPTRWGIGLDERARAQIRSVRMIEEELPFLALSPRNDLLSDRDPNEAYCAADPGSAYVVYFPEGGAVDLDLTGTDGSFEVRWLDADEAAWTDSDVVSGGGQRTLSAPASGNRLAVVKR
ncbi:hypothetical protein [Halosimplex sp. TS25]|uniref:hypothetical protein n=1 Tax=Halosimplex rarum TaxID=3396619 RepID=UPI0039EC0175